jgi:hypothetical protein
VVSAAEIVAFTVLCWVLSRPTGRREVWRAAWIEFLILGSFILSYYGAYGPLPKPAIAFPFDDLIALGIGLVTYYWAVAAGFVTEEIRAIVEKGTGVVEEEEESAMAPQAQAGTSPDRGPAI